MSTLASTAIPSDSTIPAIPERVSTAWNEARMPKMKKILRMSPRLATSPGITPYIAIMKIMSSTRATANDIMPSWIAC